MTIKKIGTPSPTIPTVQPQGTKAPAKTETASPAKTTGWSPAGQAHTAAVAEDKGSMLYELKKKVALAATSINYASRASKITPTSHDELLPKLNAGDMLLRRTNGTTSNWFIPGKWGHAAIYAGNGMVIDATTHGVRKIPLKDFMAEGDELVAMHNKNFSPDMGQKAAAFAEKQLGKPYDFDLDFNDDAKFVCSELVNSAYRNVTGLDLAKPSGISHSVAPGELATKDFEIVWTTDDKKGAAPEKGVGTTISEAWAKQSSSTADFFKKAGEKMEQVGALAGYIGKVIHTEIEGALNGVEKWTDLSNRLKKTISATPVPKLAPGQTAFENPQFLKDLEAFTGTKFTAGNTTQLLPDGPEALKKRDEMIMGAKSSVHMATWALQNDETGNHTVDLLLAKKKANPDVDIKLMVDGTVAGLKGTYDLLDKRQAELEAAGIQVVRWANPDRPELVQHRKFISVDGGNQVIAGGRNPANHYFGQGNKQKWKDTEMLVSGAAGKQAENVFKELWNEQAKRGLPGVTPVKEPPAEVKGADLSDQAPKVAFVNHTPGKGDTFMLAALKSIQGATKSISIANAYVIDFPVLREALVDAQKRGVDVKILTNSGTSVDEPSISIPIMRSAKELAQSGIDVHLKTGDTIHSKYMVVDEQFFVVGSFNMHPRSQYYDGETSFMGIDPKFAKSLQGDFNASIAKEATDIGDGKSVKIPDGILNDFKGWLVGGPFFRQL